MTGQLRAQSLIWRSAIICLLLVGSSVKGQSDFSATLIGGSELEKSWTHAGLTTDPDGNIYVAATTRSADFPATGGAYDQDYNGGLSDVVICKFSPDLSTLIAATYLGGTATDELPTIIHDGNGHIIVAGQTNSTNFPVTAGSYRESNAGYFDFFIARFDDDLSVLLEATYLGGVYSETACDLVLDADHDIFICGVTGSVDFPIIPGAYDPTRTTNRDVCVAKMSSDLSSLLASTFFGPEAVDGHPAMAIDNSGNIVITGSTLSSTFPTTPGAYQVTYAGFLEIYISKFSPDLTSLLASTCFGSSSGDMAFGVAVDGSDNIYVVGHPQSGYPTTPGSYSPGFNGGVADAGVAKFNSDLTTLLASTFVGGSGNDAALGIALHSDGSVIVSGYTSSTNFPVAPRNIDGTPNGADDAYVVMLSSDLSTLIASTLVGGSSTEDGNAVVAVSGGRIVLAGSTSSADFPATPGAYDEDYNGTGTSGEFWGGDLFVSSMAFPQFTRITEGHLVNSGGPSQGVAWADYDGDSYPDVVVTNMLYPSGHDNWLYHNEAGSSLVEVSGSVVFHDGGASRSATWGDYDNDGDPDLFMTNLISQENYLYRNDGSSGFAGITGQVINSHSSSSTSASWVDYDNDGDLDLYVSNYGPNRMFRNDGESFTVDTDAGPIVTDSYDSYGVAWADYDNDGDVDLFVAVIGEGSPIKNNHLYTNNGDGSFSAVTGQSVVNDGGVSPAGSWGDYDNDGDLDLFVTNIPSNDNGHNFLYRNNGDGTFDAVTEGSIVSDGGYSFGSSWGDYDNDGDLDLYVCNYVYGQSNVNFLYTNDGNGGFERFSGEAIATDVNGSIGAAWADYDRDGDLDLMVANSLNDNENNALYVNNGNGNNWINIKLVGTVSNRSAIGAKIHAKAVIGNDPVWQLRDISGQTGYCSQNDLNAHFGLGDATVIDSLKVEWPSGIVRVMANVEVDQFLTVYEPCCNGRVGDANGEGEYPDEVTLGDIMLLVDVKFISSDCSKLTCLAEADVNQDGGINPDCDDHVTLGDIMTLVDFLFITGPEAATLPDCLSSSGGLVIPHGAGATIDGIIQAGEWTDASTAVLSIEGVIDVTVRVKHDGANLLAAYSYSYVGEEGLCLPEILIDTENDKNSGWQNDDWWFHVSASDCEARGTYDIYNDCSIVQPDWQAVPNFPMTPNPSPLDTFEISIPFSKVGVSAGSTIGIAFRVEFVPTMFGYWPPSASPDSPATWGTAIITP